MKNKTYHTVGTIPESNIKTKSYHTVGTIPESNIKTKHTTLSEQFQNQISKQIKVITKLPNSEQSYKGKVKTHNYINRQNQSTTGKL